MRKLQGNKLVITFVCESTAVHSHNVHSTHKQPLQHIPSTSTDSSMFQHHITGKHYNINSCHVVITVEETVSSRAVHWYKCSMPQQCTKIRS